MTAISGAVARRNERSAAFNATVVTAIGYVVITAVLVMVVASMVPPMVRNPIASVLPPIAISGAVAAAIAWVLSFASAGRARKARA